MWDNKKSDKRKVLIGFLAGICVVLSCAQSGDLIIYAKDVLFNDDVAKLNAANVQEAVEKVAAYSSAAASVTSTKVSNWDTAHSWGDHSTAGYLKTETDPNYSASAAASVTSTKVGNWDAAHSWGDHSTAGYLKAETDPNYSASAAASVTSTKVSNWDTAHSWGNHADQKYQKGVVACPSPYTLINLSNSTLCIYRVAFPSAQSWNDAESTCYDDHSGGQLCTYAQLRRACKHGNYTLTQDSWLRDRVGDDTSLLVNGIDCENFDGVSGNVHTATKLTGAYCCLEWPSYPM